MTSPFTYIDSGNPPTIPTEYDCQTCGAHHVLLPERVAAILNALWLTCDECERGFLRQNLGGLMVEHDKVYPICKSCEAVIREAET